MSRRVTIRDEVRNIIISRTLEKVRHKRAAGALVGGISGYIEDRGLSGNIVLSIKILEFMMQNQQYFRNSVGEMYLEWFNNNPPDVSAPIRNAFYKARDYNDICYQAYTRNFGNLDSDPIVRLFPLAVFCEIKKIENRSMLLWTKEDSLATHPHPIATEATKLYMVALRAAVMGIHSDDIIAVLRNLTNHVILSKIIIDSERRPGPAITETGEYSYDSNYIGNVLQTVLYELRSSRTFEINEHYGPAQKCAVGAMLGAYYGEDEIPQEMRDKVLANKELADHIEKLCSVDRKK